MVELGRSTEAGRSDVTSSGDQVSGATTERGGGLRHLRVGGERSTSDADQRLRPAGAAQVFMRADTADRPGGSVKSEP